MSPRAEDAGDVATKEGLVPVTSPRVTIECPDCDGHGVLTKEQSYFSTADANWIADPIDIDCERCDGTGEIEPDITSAEDVATVIARARRSRA